MKYKGEDIIIVGVEKETCSECGQPYEGGETKPIIKFVDTKAPERIVKSEISKFMNASVAMSGATPEAIIRREMLVEWGDIDYEYSSAKKMPPTCNDEDCGICS